MWTLKLTGKGCDHNTPVAVTTSVIYTNYNIFINFTKFIPITHILTTYSVRHLVYIVRHTHTHTVKSYNSKKNYDKSGS